MAKKKNTYKVPSIVALTLAGTALTTHHAQAASNTQDQTPNKNVLDDEKALNQSEQIKSEISKPTTNISGTQTYQDPTQVKDASSNEDTNYDAQLDELNDQTSEQTSNQDTYNQETDVQEDQQDVSSDNDTKSLDTEQTSVEDNNQENEENNTDSIQSETNSTNEASQTSNDVSSNAEETNTDENSSDVANQNEPVAQNDKAETSNEDVASSDVKQDDTQSDANTSDVADQNESETQNDNAETSKEDDVASSDVKQDDTQSDANASDDVKDQNESETQNDKAESSNEDDIASFDVKQDDTHSDANASDDVKDQNESETQNDKAETSNEDVASSDKQDDTHSDANASDIADQNESATQDDKAETSNEDVASSDVNQDGTHSDDNASDVTDQNESVAQNDKAETSNEDVASSDVKQDDTQSDANASDDVKDQNESETQNDKAESSNEDDVASSDVKQDDTQSDANASDDVKDQNESETQNDKAESSNEDVASSDKQDDTHSNDSASDIADQNESATQDDKATSKEDDVASNDKQDNAKVSTSSKEASTAENKVQPATFSAKVTPKLRVATTSANTAVATRSAVTKEATTRAALPKYSPKVNSSINNYIRKNNFKAPNYEQDIANYLPQYNYRYGKPEGIVMHDTANDNSTITGEINYMKNNYTSAFVHAYVDGDRIIETANTDYLAWGAGPQANDRFIHVELVHTHDYDSFARSINNYADYAATNLQYYGLVPDSAEYDGVGTVWTHQAVSNYLGGSDHSDPHGYLAAHNYSYDELYDLIYEKYLIKTGQAAAWGTTSSGSTGGTGGSTGSGNTGTTTPSKSGTVKVTENNGVGRINSKNDGLYTTVYDQKGKKTDRVNQTLKVTKSATLGKEQYYLVSDYNKGTLIGWVHQGDVSYNAAKAAAKINKTYKINPGEVIYTVPWGTSSQKAGSVSGKSAQTFKATKQQQIGKTNYIYGTVNNLTGWVSLSKLTAPPTTPSKPSTTAKLVVSNLTNQQGTVAKSNHGVYTSVYDKQGVQKSYVNGQTYKLSKKATLGSNAFYLITDNKTNTNLGWMQTGDITVKETAKKPAATQTQTVSKIGQLNATNSGIKTTVYDPKGKDASKFSGKTFTVTKQRTQGNNTYVLIQNTNQNTPIGWVNTKDINTRNLSKTTAKNGQYTVKATNNGLYAVPWGTKSQQLDTLKNVKNNQFNASKSVYVDKDEYIYGIVNNKTGWIAAKDLNSTTKTPSVTKSAVTPIKYDYIIHNQKGSYYIDPLTGKAAGSLKDFYEGIFTVFEKQVINGVTWYHGKLANGKVVWVKEDDLRKELVKYYKSGLTLDQAVAIQKGLKFKPQIQHTAGKWQDASATEIKNAMDSSKLIKDPTQKYQFLRLDKSQNISSADLDKLLVGKGILEGQGEAFSEAAKAYNINEVYLISHALLETGNGTSKLANGGDVVNGKVVTNGKDKYYNMFGIGAVDSDAVKQGFATAKNNGWNTVKKAIVGGAKFIAGSYINQGQNTLYKMRWNPENPGVHQYATDVAWAAHNATRIKGFYDSMGKLGKYFDVDTYK
ncbi:GW dipeptide domain-containing protein [Staphylococcus saprophyticus]|uniref:GW dipeptide domain-containing protein n=1 Tax=Staphylococcus saprophyticus TaxID=29385 RepID=UPI000DFA9F05|nr:GW dipeptide domain-containing protein [Staphylococcus saprophyticus]MDW4180005.1 GW dipeptide domain-containing protein [Staphylococcus saprophyticus]MDW4237096.1 GW dipeptide domain-containing protein [Staphylococcus saprophyticus]MDW4242223.1 GW dipeptide domain-containing protein [Staphylococcus saprophyticus]MDW4324510.1 GW dipeptide domain-containing protein [Staphylococcus saprophyticus]MDW4371390.1 GW dipeptide domain-containing protein [Staphylococcus saprophyticus]